MLHNNMVLLEFDQEKTVGLLYAGNWQLLTFNFKLYLYLYVPPPPPLKPGKMDTEAVRHCQGALELFLEPALYCLP
jgi:hypothetical protein